MQIKHILIFYCISVITNSIEFSIKPSLCKTDECIEIYECEYFVSLWRNSNRTKLEVIAEIELNQCGFINTNPAVCCPQEVQKIEEIVQISEHENLYLLPIDNCGVLQINSRIIHGEATRINEFPWMALIAHNTGLKYTKNFPIRIFFPATGFEFLCGGTLISVKYVLTAAHCITDAIVGVRLGEYNLASIEDCDEINSYCLPPVQDFNIEKVIIHADFNRKTHQNDIAIIKLATPADITYGNVAPICLPIYGESDMYGKSLTISGWGFTETGRKSDILQRASIPQIPLPICQKIYEQLELGPKHICAGGDRADSCNGDSGGPLSMTVPFRGAQRNVQYGIVSFGPSICGTYGMPGVYTRVNPYIPWILDSLEP